MRYKIVAIRDSALATYSVPQFVATVGSAIRSFSDLINGEKNNEVARHPEDFLLFELGEYDDDLGRVDNLEMPRQIASGKDLVRS